MAVSTAAQVELHVLCDECSSAFRNSKIIHRGKRGEEVIKIKDSVEAVEESAQKGCHFCNHVRALYDNARAKAAASEAPLEPATRLPVSKHIVRWKRAWSIGAHLSIRREGVFLVIQNDRTGQRISVSSNFLYQPDLEIGSCPLSPSKDRSATSCELKSDFEVAAQYTPHDCVEYTSTSSLSHLELIKFWLGGCRRDHSICENRIGERNTRRTMTDIEQDRIRDPMMATREYKSARRFRTTFRLLKIRKDQAGGRLVSLACEIPPQRPPEYCCLTHSWGGVDDILKLTSENTEQMQQGIDITTLPRTFQDAIVITSELGYEWLWIDSLCIVQDSRQDWLQQSAIMGDIFERANCTIAAAAARNPHGGCYQSRDPLPLTKCRITPNLFVRALIPGQMDLYRKDLKFLRSRAWVFQERCLSRRVLSFGSSGIYWECRHGFATEHFPHGWGRTSPGIDPPSRIFDVAADELTQPEPSNRPDFDACWALLNDSWGSYENFHTTWFTLVGAYSRCNLTFENDKLPAMAGLAQRIQEETGFLYYAGLWQETVLMDLLWTTNDPSPYGRSNYSAPTWSWAAVDKQVDGLNVQDIAFTEMAWMVRIVSTRGFGFAGDSRDFMSNIDMSMTVSGRLKEAHVGKRTGSRYLLYTKDYHTDQNIGELTPDTLTLDGSAVYLLLFYIGQGDTSAIGLTLTPDEYKTRTRGDGLRAFERVGKFTVLTTPGFDSLAWFGSVEKEELVIV